MIGSFFVEPDEDGWHVVHAVLISAVFWDQFIEELFTDTFEFLSIESALDPVDHLCVRLYLPYTIAAHYNKIYVFVFYLRDVRLCCYHLLLRRQTIVLFVLSVTQSSWEVEPTIDSSKGDCSSGFGDSIDFFRILRLMISAKLLGLALDASDGSGVTSISAVHKLRSDQNNVGCASSMWLLLVLGTVLNLSHLFLNGYDLLFSTGSENQLVHFQKCLLQSQLVVPLLVVTVCL